MRGKSYLSMGGVSMGIGGSIVDQDFFEDYLGMRVEVIDMVEFVRRMNEEHLRSRGVCHGAGVGERELP